MNYKILFLPLLAIMLACSTTKPTSQKTKKGEPTVSIDMDSIVMKEIYASQNDDPYQPTSDKVFDLVHTKLQVNFDYKKRHLNGIANITLQSHFYPNNILILDAKGMDIKSIKLNNNVLKYTYDSLQLTIFLDKKYTKNEKFTLEIIYTAKPNELPDPKGSAAITSDKGLYFIDPDGTDPNKPTQIWTQGETEASSCWFPTIDKPNQKTTQEIEITVPSQYVTLSNGRMERSTPNADGTRTDYWKQNLPHAPYLFMMVVGEFSIYKDTWNGKEVSYYLEPEYAPYAKNIFGNAPEMIEFFSTKITGVAYPWDKFANVVVREYVSGAMENTGAVIYMDALQQTAREQLDNDYETIVAHELFHHWFGDLVTCESWGNLSLNESFANYSEYLWLEHKYGRDQADFENVSETAGYMRDAANKKKKLIRYYYSNKEDMFDGHSYNKGGRILHMLRTELGDDAFFSGMNKYLSTHQYKSAEVHDLRLAFEEVSGRDLNWFFNQWYFEAGHPILKYTYSHDEVSGEASIEITQRQVADGDIVFRLPIAVDIYSGGKATRHEIVISKEKETFVLPCPTKPDFINADARKTTLCKKSENKTIAEYAKQYQLAPLYYDRYEAIAAAAEAADGNKQANEILYQALADKHYTLRKTAIEKINLDDSLMAFKALPIIERMALNEVKSQVRSTATKKLRDNSLSKYKHVYMEGLKDSSYAVIISSLKALAKLDEDKANAEARKLMNEKNASLANAIMQVINDADTTFASDFDFFDKWANKNTGFNKVSILGNYTTFVLKSKNLDLIEKATQTIDKGWTNNETPWFNGAFSSGLDKIKKYYKDNNMLEKAANVEMLINKHKEK